MAFKAISVQLMNRVLSSKSQSEFNDAIDEIRGTEGEGAVSKTFEFIKESPIASGVREFLP
jgi:hypothetical protein